MLASDFHQARSALPLGAISVLVHLQKPITGLPRPQSDSDFYGAAGGPGGEGGNRVVPCAGTLLAASLALSAICVALVTAALFY
jgi:hypothetical protein